MITLTAEECPLIPLINLDIVSREAFGLFECTNGNETRDGLREEFVYRRHGHCSNPLQLPENIDI